MHTQGNHKTQGEGGVCETKREASRDTGPALTFISDSRSPELQENRFLLFKLRGLCSFVTAA